MKKQQAA
jgi:hypothetical protein